MFRIQSQLPTNNVKVSQVRWYSELKKDLRFNWNRAFNQLELLKNDCDDSSYYSHRCIDVASSTLTSRLVNQNSRFLNRRTIAIDPDKKSDIRDVGSIADLADVADFCCFSLILDTPGTLAPLVPEISEKHFSTLETRTRISHIQSRTSRRDREFLSPNLMLWDKTENNFLQSQASRRDREFSWSFLSFRDENEKFWYCHIFQRNWILLNIFTRKFGEVFFIGPKWAWGLIYGSGHLSVTKGSNYFPKLLWNYQGIFCILSSFWEQTLLTGVQRCILKLFFPIELFDEDITPSTWKPYKILPDKAVGFQRCRLHEIDSQNDTNWKYNQKCYVQVSIVNFHFL